MPIGIRQPFRPRYPGDIGEVDPALQAIADAAAAEDAAQFAPVAPMGDVTMSPEAAAIFELAKQRIGVRQQQPDPAEVARAGRIGVPILPQEAGGFTPNPYNGPGIQYGPPGTVFRNEGGAGLPPLRTDRPYFEPGTMPPEDEGIDPRTLVTDDMRLRSQQAMDKAGISQANRIQNPETFGTDLEMAHRDKFDKQLRTAPEYKTFRDRRVQREAEFDAAHDAVEKRSRERGMTPKNLVLQMIGGGGLDNPMFAGMVGGKDAANVALGMKQIEGQAKEGRENRAMELTKAGMLTKERLAQEAAARAAQLAKDKRDFFIQNRDLPPDVLEQEWREVSGEGPAFPADGPQALPVLGNGSIPSPPRIAGMSPVEKQLSRRLHNVLNSDNATTASFFGPAGFRLEELLAEPDIVKRNADLIRSRFGVDDLVQSLGGEYPRTDPRFQSPEELRLQNQRNILRQTLGVPMFKPLPTDDFGVFGDFWGALARGASGSGF